MSWLFSRALVEEYSAANCLDGEQSAPLSGSPTPQAYCAPDKMTAFFRLSRFGMTFKPLMEQDGEELLTLFRAGFPAKTSAQRGGGLALTESAAECGEKWHASFTKYSPDTSSWKTHQCSLLGDLDEFLETWPQWGLMRDGECWEQQTLVRPINETASGLWPTPTASMMPCEGTQRIMRKKWLAGELSLEEASAVAGRDVRKAQGKVPIWPTPQSRDYRSGDAIDSPRTQRKMAAGWSSNLNDVVKWSTPTVQDSKNNGAKSQMERNSLPLNAQVGGSLNPTWVEWLMGWPLGWTDLKPLETDKSPSVPQQHGDC